MIAPGGPIPLPAVSRAAEFPTGHGCAPVTPRLKLPPGALASIKIEAGESAPDTHRSPFGLEDTGSPNLSRLWTLIGFPTVNVPGLRDGNGMPLGIQVIGRFGQDRGIHPASIAWQV